MEVGYSTLDLVMLAIAAFVVWAAMRTPKLKNMADDAGLNLTDQPDGNSAHTVAS